LAANGDVQLQEALAKSVEKKKFCNTPVIKSSGIIDLSKEVVQQVSQRNFNLAPKA
jgi:hypothetical protein